MRKSVTSLGLFSCEKSPSKRLWVDEKLIDISYLENKTQVESFAVEKKGLYKIIDVRELDEYLQKHIEHATLMPTSELEKSTPSFLVHSDLHAIALVHCRSGRRTANYETQIVEKLAKAGFIEIYFMNRGIEGVSECKNEREKPLFYTLTR